MKCIAAHTKSDSSQRIYPGYVNVSRQDDGSFVVTVRADPTIVDTGVFICGYERDRGKPGRCVPGDDNCNNYCNMAPQKGPMQKSPKSCRQVLCGAEARLTLSAEEFASLKGQINEGDES